MTIKYAEIAEIIKLIEASSCDELILETDELKLVVRRGGAGGEATVSTTPSAPTETPAARTLEPAISPAKSPSQSKAKPKAPRTDGADEVRAPMVGTFYRAPSPDADPFVEEGGVVAEGDPLCLIEVMKLFTTISAKRSGRIIEIGAENATLVEYDQVLFVIEPD